MMSVVFACSDESPSRIEVVPISRVLNRHGVQVAHARMPPSRPDATGRRPCGIERLADAQGVGAVCGQPFPQRRSSASTTRVFNPRPQPLSGQLAVP